METGTAPTSTAVSDSAAAAKRKRSPSASSISTPVAKAAKTSSQMSINYLARQSQDDLPLISKDDNLPNLIHLLSAYSNILDRHESLASNLGARPLGPILIKRFERCFDSPPKIVASHHRNASGDPAETSHTITWLEVIEFARAHPAQFTLSTFSEGRRVCQFYYPQKQLRVQISEEDFLFINSGRCQELIPPLPIWEDEEKEVGTCDVLEAKLKELTNAADMVAARTRQLSHRLKGRRVAILERRAEGGSGTPAKASALQTTTAHPSTSGSGFNAVNANTTNGRAVTEHAEPILGSNAAVRTELLRHFESLPHNQTTPKLHARHQSTAISFDTAQQTPQTTEFSGITHNDGATSTTSSLSPVPINVLNDSLPYTTEGNQASISNYTHRSSLSTSIPYTASHAPSKHNFSRPLPPDLESSQPFRPLCQAHMDSLPRGTRVIPPCDRCRRLRMDCVKNLTSCAGCTRKHARCHWRDVSREELGALDNMMDSAYPSTGGSSTIDSHLPSGMNGDHREESDDDESNPLEDLEALGEKEEQENQIREDEDGLRNAKELARQGWKESLRDTQQAQAGDAHLVEAVAVHNDAHESVHPATKVEAPLSSAIVQRDSTDLSPHDLDKDDDSKGPTSPTTDTTPVSPKMSYNVTANTGGFRAVNDVTSNGGTNGTNGTGWRAS